MVTAVGCHRRRLKSFEEMSALQQLIEWDQSLFLVLNNVHTPFWDTFMWIYTDKLTWIPLILSILFVLFRKNWKEAALVCIAIALTITVCDQFASSLCKPYFARFRPAQDPQFSSFVQIVNGYRGGRYGFISSHAANSFGAIVLLSLIFRNRLFTVVSVLWAIVNCYSRIYLGVHYPGDIIGGTIAGIIFAVIIYIILNQTRHILWKKRILSDKQSPYFKDPDIQIVTGMIGLSVLGIAIYAIF